ncbi:hypothetical protein GYH30_011981 [Glycine max]|nr:hypothetical protein GYH30_011981 [Glycine max]
MASPPASPPPPPPSDASASPFAMMRTRKASRLRSLSTGPPGAERPVVHVDPATGKADGPHRKKLRIYLGIVAHDKVDVTYENWKENLKTQRLLTVGRKGSSFRLRWRQFKSNLMRKWALAADQDGVDDTVCEKYDISKEKWSQFCQTRRDPSWENVITDAIGHLEHLGRVCVAGAGVTIKQYFGSAPWTSRSSSSLPLEELQQLTQQIKDQLEESITEKVTRQLMALFSQMQSQFQS